MKRKIPLLAAGGLLALLLFVLLLFRSRDREGREAGKESNVVILSLDALRARDVGAYGCPRNTTPNIDHVAEGGVVFKNAFSQSSWTIPALSSMLSSMYPNQHKALKLKLALSEEVPLLTEILKKEGYATAAFLGSTYPLFEMGFERGFDARGKDPAKIGPEIKKWIEDHKDEKIFLWIHYFKPHAPYAPSPAFDRVFTEAGIEEHRHLARYWDPEECRLRYANRNPEEERIRKALYDACILESDFHTGEILGEIERLGLSGKTLVIVTSDHGEEFFEHGGMDHGRTMYDEVLHVPLILKHPSLFKGGIVVENQVRIIDIAPTILDVLGFPKPEWMEGESLVPLIRAKKEGDRPLYAGYLPSGDPVITLRDEGFKLTIWPNQKTEEFYDLRKDPEEKNNLVEPGHPRMNAYRRRLYRWYREKKSDLTPKEIFFDEETMERLRALGYVE